MKRRNVLTLVLLAAVCLTGCGPSAAAREADPQPGLYERASGIDPDTVLLTAGGRDIPAWRYLYWLAYDCDYLQESLDAQGRFLDWNERREDGRTMAQYVKDQARDTAVLYAVVEAWAEEYGCGLTAEDGEAMEREWERLCGKYGGERRYLAELAWMGLTRQQAEGFTADYFRYGRLQDLAQTPGSALAPPEAELDAFIQAHGYITADILYLSTRNTDEAALAAVRERAERVRQELSEGADPVGTFPSLIKTYGDQEGSRTDCTFSPGDGQVDAVAEQAAQALAEGQCSAVLDVPGGLAVVLRLPLDRTVPAADWLDDALRQASSDAEVTVSKAYESIDPADFYEKLTAARQSLDRSGGAEEAPSSPSG